MRRQRFLGIGAPPSADATLAIEIARGATLVLGMLLVRRQRYRARLVPEPSCRAQTDHDCTTYDARFPQSSCSEDSCAPPSLLRWLMGTRRRDVSLSAGLVHHLDRRNQEPELRAL
jgi:hypothetical protein